MTTIVFGLYNNLSDARRVVQDIIDDGFIRDNISLVVKNADGHYPTHVQAQQPEVTAKPSLEEEKEGAVTGGVLGGLSGLLLGLGVFALPGVGSIIAGGPLVAMLVGAGAGTVTGGLMGSIIQWNVPKDEAEYFVESVHQGRALISATTSSERVNRLVTIMNRYHPLNEIKSYTTAETELT